MHDLTIVLSSNNKWGILEYLKEVPAEILKSDCDKVEAELLKIEDAKSVLGVARGLDNSQSAGRRPMSGNEYSRDVLVDHWAAHRAVHSPLTEKVPNGTNKGTDYEDPLHA